MSKSIRADLVFSYWVYVWYILYELKFISYSPKFALILGIIDNIIMFLLMIMFSSKTKTIILFIIINVFIKVLPIYYLQKEVIVLKDVYFTCFLFIIFIIWLHVNRQNLVGNLKLVHDSLLYNKSQTPFFQFIDKMQKNYEKM